MADQAPMHPEDPRDYRCSSTDRGVVAAAVEKAAAEGRLDLDEAADRLSMVYAARTYRDLEKAVQDLPPSVVPRHVWPQSAAPSVPPADLTVTGGRTGMARVVGPLTAESTPTSSVAIFSEAKRSGVWVLPPAYSAVSVFGSVKLDLRDALLVGAESEIRAIAVMGEVKLVIPRDVRVVSDGIRILGSFDDSHEPGLGQPVVRVTGAAILGEVTVKRR